MAGNCLICYHFISTEQMLSDKMKERVLTMDIEKNIAERIQKLRKERGLSQEELAEVVNVSRQAVSKWESEQSLPDIDKIIALSEYFEVSADYLLKGEETRTGNEPHIPLNPLTLVTFTTAMNLLGLIVAAVSWNYWQTGICIGVGLVFMVFGCMVFGMGCAGLKQSERKTAVCNFVQINVWVVMFLLLSVICNAVFYGMIAPYPILVLPIGRFAITFAVYFVICGAAVWKVRKARRES